MPPTWRPGSIVLLPLDPDASARALRREMHAPDRRPTSASWSPTRRVARGARARPTSRSGPPGCVVAEDFAGRTDPHGNPLAVTLPAVADELAGAAELAQGKLAGRPVAVVRGRADLVLPPGEDGPGAASLVRPEGGDLFGWGAREAVVRALAGDDEDRRPVRGARSRPRSCAAALAACSAPAGASTARLIDDAGLLRLHLPVDADRVAVAA